jgi:phosphate transport system permease protein
MLSMPRPSAHTSKRRLIADRTARWIVSAGGIAVIASILGILIFIVVEVFPLLLPARVDAARKVAVPEAGVVEAVLSDDYRTHVATLDDRGVVRVERLSDGKVAYTANLPASSLTAAGVPPQSKAFAAATSDGRVLIKSMAFGVSFQGSERVITPDETPPVALDLDPAKRPLSAFAAQIDADGNVLAAGALADGKLAVARRSVQKNEITGEATASLSRAEVDAPGKITALVIDAPQKNLYAGTAGGDLLWWALENGQPGNLHTVNAGAPVTALNLLLGGRSLAVGQENGALSVWFPVNAGDTVRLARTHEFPRQPGAVRRIAPSQRDRSFLAAGERELGLYFSTADRTLWTGAAPVRGVTALFYTPKADGALVAGGGEVAALDVRNPHPEVTPRSLFGKVWYEGYDHPAWVWQSSGGTDDFEPKLSLTPLLVGTLKGTIPASSPPSWSASAARWGRP